MIKYILDRRMSFVFSLSSIGYGFYHIFNPNVINEYSSYETLSFVFGFIGGGWFGLIFVLLGTLKLIGLIFDITILKLPMYFALLPMWVILGVCFFISFLQGNLNPSWIYTFTIAGLSSGILTNTSSIIKGVDRD